MPKLSRALTILLFILGIGCILYPPGAKLWNSYQQQKVVSSYEQQVLGDRGKGQCGALWEQAKRYEAEGENSSISYEKTLILKGNEAMGTLVIPKIHVNLPIYHGTSDDVLQKGAGHLKKSDLPIGGEGNHCVITGHRGLPSARLFTRLDELQEGDRFYLKVLDEVLAYEVCRVYPMVPKDDLETIDQITSSKHGEDLVTLITCTPYGVNTHRLLVQANRVTYQGELEQVETQKERKKTDFGKWIPVILVLIAVIVIGGIYSVKKLGVLLLCGLLMAGLWTGYGKAAEVPKSENTCSLEIQAEQQEEAIPVLVYCVATWSEQGTYEISQDFLDCGIEKLSDKSTTEDVMRVTEKARRKTQHLSPVAKLTLKEGHAKLKNLKTGLYLVVPKSVSVTGGEGTYRFAPALVCLPQDGTVLEGTLQLKGELVKVKKSPKTGESY